MLCGRDGDDVLNGKGRSDNMQGGADGDAFVFDTALGPGDVDTISDFDPVLDSILLDDAIFTRLLVDLLAAFALNNGGPHDADDRDIYNSASGALSLDTGGRGGPRRQRGPRREQPHRPGRPGFRPRVSGQGQVIPQPQRESSAFAVEGFLMSLSARH